MGHLAFVFPGQGAQYVGMGKDLAAAYPVVRQTFDEAGDAVGFDLGRLCFEGPEVDLVKTANQQPAILTVSVAILRLLREEGIEPQLAAGLSLGEYAALVAAGALDFSAAVPLVRRRGTFMQEAVPLGEGAMAAIIGLEAAQVEALCQSVEAAEPGSVVEPANYNCPGQTVIAGHTQAVQQACDKARQAGAKRALLLPVSAPFHCRLLRPAGERLAEALADVTLSDPTIPVIANVTARPAGAAARVRDLLIRQVASPVRWEESVRTMIAMGADTFIEVGPGNALSGFIRRIDRDVTVCGTQDAEGIAKVLDSCRRVC